MRAARRGRTTATVTVLALCATLLGSVPAGARDQPVPAGAATPPATERTQPVTLITGDVVDLVVPSGGRPEVRPRPSARPDGSRPAITVSNRGGDDLYAVPTDAVPLLAAGILDDELFNVSYLARNGYAGTGAGSLPVIVQFAPEVAAAEQRRSAGALPASDVTRVLPSIDAAAVEVDRDDTDDFWSGLRTRQRTAGRTATSPPVEKVWLDRRVTVQLDESVPMIGAPAAWEAGYDGTGVTVAVLDTGVDQAHPDLAGRVLAGQSFVPGAAVTDGHGHGTHVASTVGGSGAGQAGRFTGVAPGADLVVGKVLGDDGSGNLSWVVDGMEWATVEKGADVVNLSLGGPPSDGTDLVSQAVDDLTARTGALFVVAAGNSGPAPGTIGSPGAAATALTVASVDKDDRLADSSSRGPRAGDGGLKPDISAPGVSITAARAAGTSMGQPVDAQYTEASGTSMATPHVAGAAALLAQQHPDWSPGRLKAALMSTAVDGGFTVDEQGAGRVDVAAAVTHRVVATTANADFGIVEAGDGTPRSAQVTYANLSDAAATLDLAPSLASTAGAPAPAGTLTAPGSVTIPAGGTANVEVKLSAGSLGTARYTGAIVATSAAGVRLRTPVGVSVGDPLHKVTATVHERTLGADPARAGQSSCAVVMLHAVSGSADGRVWNRPVCWTAPSPAPHAVTFDVPSGVYSATARVTWTAGDRGQIADLFSPEIEIDGDTSVRLDADDARRVQLDTPRPAEAEYESTHWIRTTASGKALQLFQHSWYGQGVLWATPTAPVETGAFSLDQHWMLAAPRLTMATRDGPRITLHPYAGYPGDSLPFRGSRTLPLVYAGTGSAAELAAAGVRGKLVLLRLEKSDPATILRAQLQRALDAGAAGVLFHSGGAAVQYLQPDGFQDIPQIPYAVLPAAEADQLIARLGARDVRISLDGTPPGTSPYLYVLSRYEADGLPALPRYRFGTRDLGVVDAALHADKPGTGQLVWSRQRPADPEPAVLFAPVSSTPREVKVFVGPVNDGAVHRAIVGNEIGYYVFDRTTPTTAAWSTRPVAPGVPRAPVGSGFPDGAGRQWLECSGCRQGDTFFPLMLLGSAAERHSLGVHTGVTGGGETHLFRDGEEIAPAPPYAGFLVAYDLPPERAGYRLTVDHGSMHTAWRFTSGAVTTDETPDGYVCMKTLATGDRAPCRAEPLIFLRYNAGVDLANTVRRRGISPIAVTAHRQAPGGPAITGLKLSFSLDHGTTWTPVTMRGGPQEVGSRSFRGILRFPHSGPAGETVSLRTEAWDAAGNRVEQTLLDAYALRN